MTVSNSILLQCLNSPTALQQAGILSLQIDVPSAQDSFSFDGLSRTPH